MPKIYRGGNNWSDAGNNVSASALINDDGQTILGSNMFVPIGLASGTIAVSVSGTPTVLISPSQTDLPVQELWQRSTYSGIGYGISTAVATFATANETPFLYMVHPSGTGKIVRFWEQIIGLVSSSNQSAVIRVYREPIIATSGNAVEITQINPIYSDTSVCSVFSGPTVSGNGTLITSYVIANGTYNRELHLARYLTAGNRLLFTFDGSTTNLESTFSQSWMEQVL